MTEKTSPQWSCEECVRRDGPDGERVVAACGKCLPMHERTPETHTNPRERP